MKGLERAHACIWCVSMLLVVDVFLEVQQLSQPVGAVLLLPSPPATLLLL